MPESNPRNLRTVREINRRDILFSVARVPNSDRLQVGSSEGKVLELDASQANAQPRELAEHGRYVTSVRLAGRTVVSGGYDGRLLWWDLDQGRLIRTIRDAHSRWVRQIAVSPDGTKLASVADDMVCRIWNTANGERLHELRGHEARTPQNFASMLYACVFSADGRHLATGDRVGHVVIWEVASGRQITALEAPTLYTWDGVQRIRSIGGVRGLAFSHDGTHLAVGGVGQIGNVDALQGPSRVEVFDWARRERLFHFTGQNGIVNRLIYHPRGEWLCAIGGGGNGLVMFYDTARRAMIHQGNVPMHVHDAAFNEDFTTLYAVGHQKAVVMELRG
jgi:WD40 repeat protein